MSYRWGIIGCGLIAPKFVQSMEKTGEGRVVAAASKSMRRAKAFQQKTGIANVYASYEAMLKNEKLDAVYIATSHNYHYENAALCMQYGKPVLVEKAFTQTAHQAEQLIALAQREKLFLMEAMWTRFNPLIIQLRNLLSGGMIGDIEKLNIAFCVKMNPLSIKMAPWNRMYNPRLAGGALLDLGVYTLAWARMIFGEPPQTIRSSCQRAWTGVDKTSEYHFGYSKGQRADLITSFCQDRPRDALITGTVGHIRVPSFMHPSKFILSRNGQSDQTITIEPDRINNGAAGFQHEIREVHRCLRENLLESPTMPLHETLEIMKTMDTIRAQWR